MPVPWATDEVSALPSGKTGHITFGCFNNTAKYNEGVFDVWARVLAAVPDSRLVLKWRTLVDKPLCDAIRHAFVRRGIDPLRLELRPASFHVDVLKEYADIDIALDPFPFTGGITSCEALWMGVPVVTWPQSRVVSRQTFAFLSVIGLPELVAEDGDEYVRIAVDLARNHERLAEMRRSLRDKMKHSPLMDVVGFTRQLEQCLLDIYQNIYNQEQESSVSTKKILHVGPGHKQSGAKLPVVFQSSEWQEIRFDIDPANEPDIVGSMLDMSMVDSRSVDSVYSSHNIEHVYAHEVKKVLDEFLRVLKDDGFLVITCPDLQTICGLVAQDKLGEPAYQSPAGPITPLDILYGHGAAIADGHVYMAHKCGFTQKTLTQSLQQAGFTTIAGKRRLAAFDLWFVASKKEMNEAEIRELAGRVLPE